MARMLLPTLDEDGRVVDKQGRTYATRAELAAAGDGSGGTFSHTQSVASTVWDIDHDLGYDPGGVLVIGTAGTIHHPATITYLDPGAMVRLTFSISIAGVARLS